MDSRDVIVLALGRFELSGVLVAEDLRDLAHLAGVLDAWYSTGVRQCQGLRLKRGI